MHTYQILTRAVAGSVRASARSSLRFSGCSRQARLMSSAKVLDVSGIFPPIATPFNDDETIAYDKLEQNMDRWNKIPFRGYVVQGSNGEYAYLTESERIDMVKNVKAMADGRLIIAGTGCESTQATIRMTEAMAAAGAEAALVVTPCFYKGSMTNQALHSHFTKVANASPVPVILYSVPGNTAIDLDPAVIISLSSHPNIIGVKDSGGDIAKLTNLVHSTKDNDFQIMAGSAGFLMPAYAVGCVGGVCALANVLGQEVCELAALCLAGKMEEAKLLQQRMVAPNAGVTKKFGVPGMKLAMSWFGYYGGPTRSPLQPLSPADAETLKNIFTSNGFPV